MSKKFWLSKTFWFNILNGGFAMLQGTGLTHLPVSGEEQTAVLTIGNLILRFATKGAVTLS